MRVIALTGLPGSGKSEVRKVLETLGYKPRRIAQTLKNMCAALGMTDAHIEGALKEVPFAPLSVSPRRIMQVLGRKLPDAIGQPDMHARLWAAGVMREGIDKVVVEDHRYPYEANWIIGVGTQAVIWRVDRANHKPDAEAMKHAAENQHLEYDDIVFNGGDLEQLKNEVIRMERDFSGPFSI